jgi:transposase
MDKFTLVGCDLHDKSMLLKISDGREAPVKRSFQNCAGGCRAMITELKRRAALVGSSRIVFAYEASGLGFGLRDLLEENEITCHVLAPSRIERSPKHRHSKTDEKDAERILDILRGHYLAGNELPAVWIPDKQTRDDREITRARLDAQDKCSQMKTQVRTLLKRNGVTCPPECGSGWTVAYRAWLKSVSECDEPLATGARLHLASLLRQIKSLESEVEALDQEVEKLSEAPRYSAAVKNLRVMKGVGIFSAMVFLTEMGDLSRFSNRKQIGAYLGLAPSSNETGETGDRKGHITHQGSARVRYILCQMVWNRMRFDPDEKAAYERIVAKNPKHKKIAVVAGMRRLAIKMWHVARNGAA